MTDPVEGKIVTLAEQGLTSVEIAADVGVDDRAVRHVIERERIKREGQAEPLVDRSQLSMTAQQKLDAALRQYKQRLDADFSSAPQGAGASQTGLASFGP